MRGNGQLNGTFLQKHVHETNNMHLKLKLFMFNWAWGTLCFPVTTFKYALSAIFILFRQERYYTITFYYCCRLQVYQCPDEAVQMNCLSCRTKVYRKCPVIAASKITEVTLELHISFFHWRLTSHQQSESFLATFQL